MATQVTPDLIADAEWYLAAFERELDEAAAVLKQWPTLEDIEKMDFWAEWPLALDHLSRMKAYQSQAILTPDQETRLAAARIALQRLEPRIHRVFENPSMTANSGQHTSQAQQD